MRGGSSGGVAMWRSLSWLSWRGGDVVGDGDDLMERRMLVLMELLREMDLW